MPSHPVQPIRPTNAIERMYFAMSFKSATQPNLRQLYDDWKKGAALTGFNGFSEGKDDDLFFAKGKQSSSKKFFPLQELVLGKKNIAYIEQDYIRWAKTKQDILTTLKEISHLYSRRQLLGIVLHYDDVFTYSEDAKPSDIIKKNKLFPDVLLEHNCLFFDSETTICQAPFVNGPVEHIYYRVGIKTIKRIKNKELLLETNAYVNLDKHPMTLQRLIKDTEENHHGIMQTLHDFLKDIFVTVASDKILSLVGATPNDGGMK